MNTSYKIGIPSYIINSVFAFQQKEYWCWTASITNILRAYGIYNVSQEQFAKNVCGVDVRGNACDCAATDFDITQSLNFYGDDQYGDHFTVQAPLIQYSPDINKIYDELNNNKPILVAYYSNSMEMGHAVIITGGECVVQDGVTYVTKLYIRDPSPDSLNKLYNGRKEVNNVQNFLNAIYAHWYVDVYK